MRSLLRVIASCCAIATSLVIVSATEGVAVTSVAAVRFSTASALAADPSGDSSLTSVSCAGAGSCVAVGVDGVGLPVVTHGAEADGRWFWSGAAAVTPDASESGAFLSVDCPTATVCVAVGSDNASNGAFSQGARTHGRWSWSMPAAIVSDGAGGGALRAVSCPSASACVAVGTDATGQGIVTSGAAASGSWTWTKETMIDPGAAGAMSLTSVSCATERACVAVGVDAAAEGIYTSGSFVDGTWTWMTSTEVKPDAAGTGKFDSVSCPTSTSCVAVGTDGTGQAAFASGTEAAGSWAWTSAHPLAPDASGGGILTGVSCPVPSRCVAVGQDASNHGLGTFGAYAGGAWRWSGVQVLRGDGASGLDPLGVACGSQQSCVAVGDDSKGQGATVATVSRPDPPRHVIARRGDGLVRVSWSTPVFDGGLRIGAYRVTSIPGGATCTDITAADRANRCTVRHLVNGRRYRFAVTTNNGLGISFPSLPSAAVSPTQFRPPIPTPITPAVQRFAASRGSVLSATLYDVLTGQTWSLNPSALHHTASIVKLDILAALLYDCQVRHQPLSGPALGLATSMIEESDNDAATALFNLVGSAPGLSSFNVLIGLTATTVSYAWGYTNTTSLDQVRIMRLFAVPNDVLSTSSRLLGLGLLANVDPAQHWGVSSGPPSGPSVLLKNGWYPTLPGAWQVNSVGWVHQRSANYVLAVLTRSDATFGHGIISIESMATMLWSNMETMSRNDAHNGL